MWEEPGNIRLILVQPFYHPRARIAIRNYQELGPRFDHGEEGVSDRRSRHEYRVMSTANFQIDDFSHLSSASPLLSP